MTLDPLNSDTDGLRWRSLHGWEPVDGTWALLWPGHYGPFTACWLNGGWSICEDSDLRHATVGAEIALPHLVTDAMPPAELDLYPDTELNDADA
jgi:hypothetical protein